MKILSIDCSAAPASVAILDDDKIVSSSYINVGLTHSQTLVQMINSTLTNASVNLPDIDVFAINAGPGSFTGVRIGIAALKGLTALTDDNCMTVSTLESMAYNFIGLSDITVCATMDARCGQVYTATFQIHDGVVKRLTKDSAILISELENFLKTLKTDIFLVGDGAVLCYNLLGEKLNDLHLAPPHLRFQNAVSTAFCAKSALDIGIKPVSSKNILPVYLRAPQAERELKKKKEAPEC